MVKRKQKIQRGKERDKNEAKLGITLSLRLFFAHAPLSERLEKATCIFERAYFRGGGRYHREYCDSKMVPLIFGRDFAPENAEGS